MPQLVSYLNHTSDDTVSDRDEEDDVAGPLLYIDDDRRSDTSTGNDSRRVLYGNSHSSLEQTKLLEHYYHNVFLPMQSNRSEIVQGITNYITQHKNNPIVGLLWWSWRILYSIYYLVLHVILKNIIFISGTLLYKTCNCSEYSLGAESSGDDTNSTFSLAKVFVAFRNRNNFEQFWKSFGFNYLFRRVSAQVGENFSFDQFSSRVKEKVNQSDFNFPRFCDNTIVNTKYRWYNFLWKSVSEQFSLRMNQYFLSLAFLQLWKTASPTNPM